MEHEPEIELLKRDTRKTGAKIAEAAFFGYLVDEPQKPNDLLDDYHNEVPD